MQFSIITATYNRKKMLIKAIESVLAQDFDDYEHIIVDGASNDGTLDALKNYPHLKIISEPDKGVYDAMNKGIHAAKGDVVILLNSDDILPNGTLNFAIKIFKNTPSLDALYGAATIENADKTKKDIINRKDILDLSLCLDTSFPFIVNARFIKRSLFEKLGLFNIKFPRAADHDLLLRLKHTPHSFQTTDRVLYHYLSHDGSLTMHDNYADASVWKEYLDVAENGLADTEQGSALYKDYKKLYTWSVFRCWCFRVFNFSDFLKKMKFSSDSYTILLTTILHKIRIKCGV